MHSDNVSLSGLMTVRIADTRNSLEAVFLPDAGGRMISLKFQGTELLYSDLTDFSPLEIPQHSGEKEIRALKRLNGFRLWGGDKTWIAPQREWWESVPPLISDSVRWEFSLHGSDQIILSSPECRETSLAMQRKVSLTEDGLHMEETITATEDLSVPRGVWNVTQFLRPVYVYVPARLSDVKAYKEEGESEKLFNAKIAEWPLTLQDPLLDRDLSYVRIDCTEPAHFKYGGIPERGKIISVHPIKKGFLCITRKFPLLSSDPADYAHGSAWEVYNSPDKNYMELELHSTAAVLKKGESLKLSHHWIFATAGDNEELWELLESNQ